MSKSMILMAGVVLVAMAGNALAVTPPPSVPDGGSSALLLATACAGVAAFRRFLGKR
jgi:hypothetical protein